MMRLLNQTLGSAVLLTASPLPSFTGQIMGKSKPSKKALSKARRHNPIRIPDTHAPGSVPASSSTEKALPVIQKLTSASASDRAWAASAISTLIQGDAGTRRLVLGKGVLERLIGLLSDSTGAVRVEGSGALRNLAIDGGHEVCGAMYNKQILTPLGALVPQLATMIELIMTEQPLPKTAGKAEDDLTGIQVFALAENVLTLFWCLSETSNKILHAINQMNLAPFLLAFIVHRSKIPSSVVLAAAQCLYAITLDNPPFNMALLAQADVGEKLLQVVQSNELELVEDVLKVDKSSKKKDEGMEVETEKTGVTARIREDRKGLLRVLIAGVLHNINEEGKTELVEGLDNKVVGPILRPVLDIDLAQVVQEVEQAVPEIPDITTKDANEIKNMQTDHRSPAELKLDSIEKRLTTLMVALEVMTSVCAGLVDAEEEPVVEDDEEEEVDEDEEMDTDEQGDEQLIAKGRDQNGDDEMLPEQAQPQRTGSTSLDGLMASGMHTKLFQLANSTPLSFPPVTGGLSAHPPTTAVLSSIHLRALEALNNLLLTVSSYAPTPTPALPASVQDQNSADWKARMSWRSFIASSFTTLDSLWQGSFEVAKQVVGDINAAKELLDMKGQEIRKEILEVLGGVWVGLARIGIAGGLDVKSDQVHGLIALYHLLPSINLKTRIISALSVLSATQTLSSSDQKVIGDFFIAIVGAIQTVTTEETVAALNAVFDVYSDERCVYDQVFTTGGYLNALAGVVSKCKAMTRSVDKRKTPELRAQAEEAYENLVAFIKYRRSVA